MGKIHISEDLKLKLDKVLASKNPNNESTEISVGPAPKWKNENFAKNTNYSNQDSLNEMQNCFNSIQNCFNPMQNSFNPMQNSFNPMQNCYNKKHEESIKFDNINPKNNFFNYFNWGKIVFFTSFIGGIGLMFGIKIGRIIFY